MSAVMLFLDAGDLNCKNSCMDPSLTHANAALSNQDGFLFLIRIYTSPQPKVDFLCIDISSRIVKGYD